MILQSQVVKVGPEASHFLAEGILLLFSAKSVMTQIKNYSITISDVVLAGTIKTGQNSQDPSLAIYMLYRSLSLEILSYTMHVLPSRESMIRSLLLGGVVVDMQ